MDEEYPHRNPRTSSPGGRRRLPDQADDSWRATNRRPVPAPAGRAVDARSARGASTWTAAALVAGVAATSGYFVHVAATPAASPTGTTRVIPQPGTGTAHSQQPSVSHPVVTSGGSGVAAATTDAREHAEPDGPPDVEGASALAPCWLPEASQAREDGAARAAIAEREALGTTARVAVWPAAALRAAVGAIDRELDRLDLAASRFRADSELSRIHGRRCRRSGSDQRRSGRGGQRRAGCSAVDRRPGGPDGRRR